MFNGKIVDENGNPLPGILVKAAAEIDKDCMYCYEFETISYVRSDENGDFKLFFSNPTNETEMHLLVNHLEYGYSDNNSLSKIDYYNIQNANFQDYKVDFGNVEVYPIENFVMLSLSVSDGSEFLVIGWNIEGKVADKRINYSPFYENENTNYYYETQFLVGRNQTVTLTYYYRNLNSEEIFENSVEIQINNEPVSYEINS